MPQRQTLLIAHRLGVLQQQNGGLGVYLSEPKLHLNSRLYIITFLSVLYGIISAPYLSDICSPSHGMSSFSVVYCISFRMLLIWFVLSDVYDIRDLVIPLINV